ncbi:MAG: methylmalonyl Co-A mutase-associated GTPase MeaB [Chloroflexota bacterium]|nr:methylmalonyl Co-A mutase-associated GTPase MeaB [Chloroflexota bacterium]
MSELANRVLAGERRALARTLSLVENGHPDGETALAALFPHTGRAHTIGVTGAPGAGKSTLVAALAKALRAAGRTIAVLAVDPTSPFSGGAILGDRIRMTELHGDTGVFIRSMATRGSLGGLSRSARDAVRVMDAAGFDIVLIETVGAGQSEVEIARIAQTVLVVEAPGMGDDVQAIKAGILEIADILVINKADRPGADNTLRSLRMMLETGHPALRSQILSHHGRLMSMDAPTATQNGNGTAGALWIPSIVQTVASEHKGIDELLTAISTHRAYLHADTHLQALEQSQIAIELQDRLREALLSRLLGSLSDGEIDALIAQVQARTLTPNDAVGRLLESTRLRA